MHGESIPQVVLFYDATFNITRQTINGVVRYANTHGPWFLTLGEASASAVLPPDCRGILACEPPPGLLKRLMKLKLPLVVIDCSRFEDELNDLLETLPHVKNRTEAFGVKAAEYFLAQSPRTFAYVGMADTPGWSKTCGDAFAARVREAGGDVRIYRPKERKSDDFDDLTVWLKTLPKPLSIFAANDERAQQVLRACRHAGIVVPHEAKILGVDNDKWFCEAVHPHLSSIPFRSEESGFEAARMLDMLMLQRTDPTVALPPLRKLMPPQDVVERESTEDWIFNDPVIDKALAFIHFKKGLNILATDVAAATGLALNRIEKHCRRKMGTSLKAEIDRARMKTILQLVRETNTPIAKIARLCGLTNASTLCRLVKKETGKTTGTLRKDCGQEPG